ncbi:hypothetical protein HMI56_001854 [Coelomomyces lativittatus]|nr:hypothetical protein HMI56_001854 [Coelomomyces lativittatus]
MHGGNPTVTTGSWSLSIWYPLVYAMGPVYPMLPLTFPLLVYVFRLVSNAYLHVLWHALQNSKTMYTMDDDQFDVEAAPPTKDIHVTLRQVGKQFLQCNDPSTFTETLGRITVMCFVDREGTLVQPSPSVTHVYLPGGIQLDLTDAGYFEDPHWEDYLPLLKPLGLACLSLCPVHAGAKPKSFHPPIRYAMTQETCLCSLAKRIGFLLSSRSFHRHEKATKFSLFAPYLTEEKKVADTLFEIPWMAWTQWPTWTPPPSTTTTTMTTTQSSFPSTSSPQPQPLPPQLQPLPPPPPPPHHHHHHHAMVFGHPDLILPLCLDSWTGHDLESMSASCQEDISSWHSLAWMNDQQVLAFAYSPCVHPPPTPSTLQQRPTTLPFSKPLKSQSSLSTTSSTSLPPVASSPPSSTFPSMVFHYQAPHPTSSWTDGLCVPEYVFLGMLAYEHVPKPDVCDVIEDIGLAGIRFVYFSPCNERQTKAFGERLGLDTDWNACILLSEPGDVNASTGYVELTDIKAQLPRGISEIHHHLQQVDDIPLHVSLFAESSPSKMASMIHLFQDHQDVVCCLGSTLSLHPPRSFMAADLAIGMHPIPFTPSSSSSTSTSTSSCPLLHVASQCTSLACALQMHQDTSLYALIQLIREARTLCWSGRQAWVLAGSSALGLGVYVTWMHVLYAPWLLAPTSSREDGRVHHHPLYFLLYFVQVPIIAVTFFWTPHDPSTMKQFTERSLFRHVRKQVKYLVLRWSIPVVIMVYVHVHLLYHFEHRLPFQPPETNQSNTPPVVTPHLSFFHLTLLLWTLWLLQVILASSTFLHRTHAVWQVSPFHNKVWLSMMVLVLGLQCVVLFVSVPWSIWSTLPWPIYTVVWVSFPLQLWVHEKVKSFDRKQWIRFQKRSKLEFNTRLGMHSPGHFVFTLMLLPALPKNSRIVNLSSIAHLYPYSEGLIDIDYMRDSEKAKQMYSNTKAYGQSKLCNVLFTKKLSVLRPDLRVNCLHPGAVKTELTRHIYDSYGFVVDLLMKGARKFFFLNALDGSLTSLYVATSNELTCTGEYFTPIAKLNTVSSFGSDTILQEKLFKMSFQLVEEKLGSDILARLKSNLEAPATE